MLILAKALGLLLTPPGIIILLALLGLVLQFRWRYPGLALVGVSLAALLVLSLPVTAYALLGSLEEVRALSPPEESLRDRAEAIVVLGGGRAAEAPEYGGETVSALTLERLRYGARLHRATGLPLLVTGGAPLGETVSEAELMQQALIDFDVRAAWVESRSRNTHENAVYSRAVLEAAGLRRVLLVTHAWHMPRAEWAFTGAGLEVIPAPTGFTVSRPLATTPLDFLPSAYALLLSSRGLHERLGYFWYRLVHGAPQTSAGVAGAI
jgi:uncharacterized SAM-binding protein YcdF (DUF218 family)